MADTGTTTASELVETEDAGGVRILRLARPPVNALNLEVAQAMHDAVTRAATDPACNAVVLTGAPGVFSAGIDTRQVPAYGPEQRATMLRTINRTILALYGLEKPAVAAVTGHALGGAFVLMLTCDVRLAARGPFQLGLTESAAGIPFPAGPLAVVRAELTPAQLRILALGSVTADADSPLFAGAIDRVLDATELRDAAVAEARRLVAIRAFGRVKHQLRTATIERLEQIVARDAEPLLTHWV